MKQDEYHGYYRIACPGVEQVLAICYSRITALKLPFPDPAARLPHAAADVVGSYYIFVCSWSVFDLFFSKWLNDTGTRHLAWLRGRVYQDTRWCVKKTKTSRVIDSYDVFRYLVQELCNCFWITNTPVYSTFDTVDGPD